MAKKTKRKSDPTPQLPAHIASQIAEDQQAQAMEDALTPPSRSEAERARWQRFNKANSYTLADKYRLSIEGFKRR